MSYVHLHILHAHKFHKHIHTQINTNMHEQTHIRHTCAHTHTHGCAWLLNTLTPGFYSFTGYIPGVYKWGIIYIEP